MPNNKGYKDRPESFYQPPKENDRIRDGQSQGNYLGDGHEFNIKGKITSNAGSDYHDVARPNSGLHGNFSEKDAQLSYLTERGKKGQVIKNFTGTNEQARLHTYNAGPTAYNNRPVDEVYKPATSQNVLPADAIYRPTKLKTESTTEIPSQKNLTKKVK